MNQFILVHKNLHFNTSKRAVSRTGSTACSTVTCYYMTHSNNTQSTNSKLSSLAWISECFVVFEYRIFMSILDVYAYICIWSLSPVVFDGLCLDQIRCRFAYAFRIVIFNLIAFRTINNTCHHFVCVFHFCMAHLRPKFGICNCSVTLVPASWSTQY